MLSDIEVAEAWGRTRSLEECAKALNLSPKATAVRLRRIGVKAGRRSARTGQWDGLVTPEWLERHVLAGCTLTELRFAARDDSGRGELPDARTMRGYLDAYGLGTSSPYGAARRRHLGAELEPIVAMKLGYLGLNKKTLTDMTVRRRLGLLELSEQLGVMVQEVYEALSKFGLLRPEDVKQFKPSKVHRNAGAGTALSGPP